MTWFLALLAACTGDKAPLLDQDGDGAVFAEDCDDLDPTRTPGAPEHCDGYDEDCDGIADNQAVDGATTYADEDRDGFGDPTTVDVSCVVPARRVLQGGDCDDADATVFPGAYETCDGRDQDCDGAVDDDALDARTRYPDLDEDGYGDAAAAVTECAATGVEVGGDCDDGDATVFPGAEERCDAVDTDCDGLPDQDAIDGTVWYADADGDGYGDPAAAPVVDCTAEGRSANRFDCDDTDAAANPAAGGCALGGEASVADAALTLDGREEGDALGAVHHVADLDGDGQADLLLGAPVADRVYALRGPLTGGESLATPDATRWYTGAASFGGALLVLDLDADGAPELLVGAPDDGASGPEGGAAYVFSGPVTGNLTSSTGRLLAAEGAHDRFGAALIGVPDVDADGLPELLVGATDFGTATGRVYLLNGGAEDLESPLALFTGAEAFDRAGHALAAGDLDGDGVAELVIGAPGAQEVAVVAGGRTGTIDLEDADATFGGRGARYQTGTTVAVVGDLDGDGLEELFMGGPAGESSLSETGGEAWVVRGPVGAGGILPGVAWATFTGEAAVDLAGGAVAGGDLDGDGRDDLVMGATGNDRGGEDAGAAYVFYAVGGGTVPLAEADAIVVGHAPGLGLGAGVTLGDLDGDARADLVLGGAGESVGGPGAGATWVWVGGAR